MRKLLTLLCAVMVLFMTTASRAEGQPPLRLEMTDSYRKTRDETVDGKITMLRSLMESAESVEKREVPLYMFSETSRENINLYYLNGITDLPFIDVRDLADFLNVMSADMGEGDTVHYTAEAYGPILMLSRENASSVLFDFDEKTISFTDMDSFSQKREAVNPLDPLIAGKLEDGRVDLISHETMVYRSGSVQIIDLDHYGIPMFLHEGAGYLPLQTVSDLFLSPWSMGAVCNGQNLLVANATLLNQPGMKELYYNGSTGMKSDGLTALTYNELCLALDLFYGLKDEHGIEDFDSYFIRTGLAGKLYSKDPAVTADGLAELCMNHLSDGHSALDMPSYLLRGDVMDIIGKYILGPQLERLINLGLYSRERMKFYPEGPKGYEEVGNTAYVTFDQFAMDYEKDYYAADPENTMEDVISLLLYADRQIRREDSPIRNVVLDLSNNYGGYVDAAAAVVSWYLGNCNLVIEKSGTGASAVSTYMFDTNLDHLQDPDGDSISNGYRLFCLISPLSFSCGNLVPALFSASGRVTLVGRTSSGGACAVYPVSTADGFFLSISGNTRLSTMKNGILYSVDRGVAPDIAVTEVAHLYDRAYLTDYLNTLP